MIKRFAATGAPANPNTIVSYLKLVGYPDEYRTVFKDANQRTTGWYFSIRPKIN